MPAPAKALTLYRARHWVGLSLRFDQPETWIPKLAREHAAIESELGLPGLVFHNQGDPGTMGAIGLHVPRSNFATDEDMADFICDAANRMVNAFRPRLSELSQQA